MIKVVKCISVVLVLLACISCKKEIPVDSPSADAAVQDSLPDLNELDDSLPLPAEKSFTKEGEVTFGANTYDVVEEYTDDISLIARFYDVENGKEMISHKYRNKFIHLIDKKSKDTITIKKENFKNYIDSGEYNELLLQAALFDLDTKSGKVPLMINLCQPDTCFCEFFTVGLDTNKKLNISLFNEGDFIEE